ncbi:MAG TPA: hypothetical protein VF493_15095 [Terriglobales bacterium]
MYAEWIFQPGVSWLTLVNYIPVAATVVTTFLSLVLARATLRHVEAADKGLQLAREQFDREWSPELHVRLERVSTTDAKIIVTNLGKTSVLLQLLQLRQISHATPFERYFLNEPVVGGTTWTEHVGERLIGVAGEDFDGTLSASVTFYASGRMFRSDWFRFKIQICDGKFFQIEAITMPAHRVHVLETETHGKFRLDLVQDVAISNEDDE